MAWEWIQGGKPKVNTGAFNKTPKLTNQAKPKQKKPDPGKKYFCK